MISDCLWKKASKQEGSVLQVRKWLFVLLIASLPVCFVGGWLVGVDEGVDTGYKVACLEMKSALKQAGYVERRVARAF